MRDIDCISLLRLQENLAYVAPFGVPVSREGRNERRSSTNKSVSEVSREENDEEKSITCFRNFTILK